MIKPMRGSGFICVQAVRPFKRFNRSRCSLRSKQFEQLESFERLKE
jgi:hypothetical protein